MSRAPRRLAVALPVAALLEVLRASAVASAVWRRVVTPAHAAWAVGIGLVVGALVRGVADSGLAFEVLGVVVPIAAALFVLPLLAAVTAGERAGGYERLVAARPIPSTTWATGRLLGALVGGGLLVLLIAAGAWGVSGSLPVPETLLATRADLLPGPLDSAPVGARATWRFALPAGTRGPFDLSFETVAVHRSTGRVTIHVRRGATRDLRVHEFRPARVVTTVIDDPGEQPGDLFVTLGAGSGVVLSDAPPTLSFDERPLRASGLPIDADDRRTLLLAVLGVTAAACAFRFETACLIGVAAMVLRVPDGPMLGALLAWLWVFAIWGTALVRRQAMP